MEIFLPNSEDATGFILFLICCGAKVCFFSCNIVEAFVRLPATIKIVKNCTIELRTYNTGRANVWRIYSNVWQIYFKCMVKCMDHTIEVGLYLEGRKHLCISTPMYLTMTWNNVSHSGFQYLCQKVWPPYFFLLRK